MRRWISPSKAVFCFSVAVLLWVTQSGIALAQGNPCAAKANQGGKNPCGARNPCSAQNPCAANPCAPGGKGGTTTAKAVTVRGEIARVDPSARKLILKRDTGQLDLSVSQHSVIREGAKLKTLGDLKPGDKVMVSYVDSGRARTAWYVYAGSAATANPCGGNPCAANNPCAPKAKKGSVNPCAANPCAPKGKQVGKNPCAAKGSRGR
jgi:hypothetical protein